MKKGNLLCTFVAKRNHFANLILQGPFNQFSIGPANYRAVICDELSTFTLLPHALFLHLFLICYYRSRAALPSCCWYFLSSAHWLSCSGLTWSYFGCVTHVDQCYEQSCHYKRRKKWGENMGWVEEKGRTPSSIHHNEPKSLLENSPLFSAGLWGISVVNSIFNGIYF